MTERFSPPNSDRFAEIYPPMTEQEAVVEANRCLYCYDAPCLQACPTHIDIPTFIRKIATGNLRGSAKTILEANFLGGTCARVCPVEELCEGACVLGKDHEPIQIGRLQRHAVDFVQLKGIEVFQAGPPNGMKVAVVGSGPAGISTAAELAKRGYAVTLFEKRDLAGGLSTYGIIVLREPVEVAQREVESLKHLGVDIRTGYELTSREGLDALLTEFDAVFLGLGLGAVPAMGMPNEEHALDGIELIEKSKFDLSSIHVGDRVAVIGAGNTAVDAATVARRLGRDVTMVYRRGESEMTAYRHEYEFALLEGIKYEFYTQPIGIEVENGRVTGLKCIKVALGEPDASGRPAPVLVAGSEFVIPCDSVVKAVGQEKPALATELGLAVHKGYIEVDDDLRTSLANVYAGGDCVRVRGNATTVMATQDGKIAARAIHGDLQAKLQAAISAAGV
ncbi:NAD(P)-dependent oxidoreductase [Deinococcus yavapaiensis]|uniref:Glutamate synthase (NADPH) small subunit n=1 Tax=Deinococcus yavapaiensis KR-236 TaxID=694435 RepID=A0A318SFG3_9DEIO|nr:NAD(P)-dependent oxidoreductase [Deinococcus yavapaiensis]PYE55975.1 glutamate synthase (NADPH) small subunit [Deinococcus yavapaiensis KR-236]